MDGNENNLEIIDFVCYLRGIDIQSKEMLEKEINEILKRITESHELKSILSKKSEGFNPETFLTNSIINLGDRTELLIPSKYSIPYIVTLLYLIINRSYNLGDILEQYYYSPLGEKAECKLFSRHIFLSLAQSFEECVKVDPKPVMLLEISEEDNSKLIKYLSTIRGIISSTKVILDEKKTELFSFTSGMMDCINNSDYKLYKVLSIGFKNTLIGVHQSIELQEAINGLYALENTYIGILI